VMINHTFMGARERTELLQVMNRDQCLTAWKFLRWRGYKRAIPVDGDEVVDLSVEPDHRVQCCWMKNVLQLSASKQEVRAVWAAHGKEGNWLGCPQERDAMCSPCSWQFQNVDFIPVTACGYSKVSAKAFLGGRLSMPWAMYCHD